MDASQMAARHVNQINVFIGHQNRSFSLRSAVNVTALWPDNIPRQMRKDCAPLREWAYPELPLYSSAFACPFAQQTADAKLEDSECGFHEYVGIGDYDISKQVEYSQERMNIIRYAPYVPCVPNILVMFNYTATKIPALAMPDIFQSVVVAITFTRHEQPNDQFADALDETLPVPLLRNAHIMGSIRRTVRRKFSTSFWGGLTGTSHNFTIAETTILGPNPYDFFPRLNNTASLLLLQGINTRELRTITDVQDPSPFTAMSNIGGMVTIGGVIFSTLFGLGYAALLGLEESEKGYTEAGTTDSDGSSVNEGASGVHQRNEHDTEEENTVLLPPLSRHKTI
ncbi:hypothetical protein BOTBODRAFT_264051 [Botryobasidium botryosum FD-172 SS1]|uniref:Uncharacterized protein n=1 Tax=Botryobasidium botryosum (strain FD-172 SS1) TaxID=930990 RepID=A0A067M2X6_BOTB1|nr:hypothetical protein BOTBODRAFT_264051 [Botryobasidium botryosum FD-172 SS1]